MQELRARAAAARRRAAADRERAARDRRQAAADRAFALRDRGLAARDRRLAATDELTGAQRRGAGLEEVQHEVDRARRTAQPLIAVYVDVDGLKRVNDERGHAAGDELLRRVAACLRSRMRSYDLLVRLGGDEFLCVLPGATAAETRERFDALASDLTADPAAGSVSIGLAELRYGEPARDLVARADLDLLAGRTLVRES